MPVVSNTSPLLNLSILGKLNLVAEQFPSVLIPDAVYHELQVNTNLPGAAALRKALKSGWLKRVQVNNVHVTQALRITLDQGESEAIALALERGISKILLDENDGREIANLMGLQPVGVLGVLLLAKNSGQIPAVEPYIHQLRTQAGFFIAPALEKNILQAAGE